MSIKLWMASWIVKTSRVLEKREYDRASQLLRDTARRITRTTRTHAAGSKRSRPWGLTHLQVFLILALLTLIIINVREP
ncbi:hypothetical protein ABEG18_06255 [Alsobacter sp. KACC 23698]|uniref:Uncharacterized protein n=1 Tax=Alsobacter sp. KACC 23698 TaxID=3149229 RepID=A0AAU7JJH2_9HYPH